MIIRQVYIFYFRSLNSLIEAIDRRKRSPDGIGNHDHDHRAHYDLNSQFDPNTHLSQQVTEVTQQLTDKVVTHKQTRHNKYHFTSRDQLVNNLGHLVTAHRYVEERGQGMSAAV